MEPGNIPSTAISYEVSESTPKHLRGGAAAKVVRPYDSLDQGSLNAGSISVSGDEANSWPRTAVARLTDKRTRLRSAAGEHITKSPTRVQPVTELALTWNLGLRRTDSEVFALPTQGTPAGGH